MGTQQLLLIVLGVIIVGIAIVVGIQMFETSAAEASKNAIIQDLLTAASKAQAWYRKPSALGGGNYSFDGLSSKADLYNKAGIDTSTDNGSIIAVPVCNDTALQIVMRGKVTNRAGKVFQDTVYITATSANVGTGVWVSP